jgi:hypothetical protein
MLKRRPAIGCADQKTRKLPPRGRGKRFRHNVRPSGATRPPRRPPSRWASGRPPGRRPHRRLNSRPLALVEDLHQDAVVLHPAPGRGPCPRAMGRGRATGECSGILTTTRGRPRPLLRQVREPRAIRRRAGRRPRGVPGAGLGQHRRGEQRSTRGRIRTCDLWLRRDTWAGDGGSLEGEKLPHRAHFRLSPPTPIHRRSLPAVPTRFPWGNRAAATGLRSRRNPPTARHRRERAVIPGREQGFSVETTAHSCFWRSWDVTTPHPALGPAIP